MAFPPPKPKPQGPGGPPPGPGMPPPGPGGMGLPPNMPPNLGAPLGPPAGMPKPGAGMDPFSAMMNGLGGAMPPPPPGPGAGVPMGPEGLPIGGGMPDPGGDMSGMDGSSLMQALMGGGGGGMGGMGGPLDGLGGDTSLQGIGTGDPNGGLMELLNQMALARMGVQGGPGGMPGGPGGMPGGLGSSGLDMPPGGGFGGMPGF